MEIELTFIKSKLIIYAKICKSAKGRRCGAAVRVVRGSGTADTN